MPRFNPGAFKPVMAAFVLATSAALPAYAGPYSNIYIFGDSLSDTGTLQILTRGAAPNPADGPYFGGRYSDGPLWVEMLAKDLGLTNDAKSFLQGGNNYAVAGARVNSGGPSDPPSLLAQLVGLWTTAVADPNALYIMVAGGNDMRDSRTAFSGNTAADQAGRQGKADAAAAGLKQGLGVLASKGAKNVLIANLPNLGGSPEAFLTNTVAASTDASNRFNATIGGVAEAGKSLGLRMFSLDMAGLGLSILDDALTNGGAKFGITNVSAPCTGFAFSVPLGGTSCDKSLFSDVLHPSARAHALIGQAAFDVVPEPSSVLLVGLAMTTLALMRKRA
jgi:outer membrane lipase/esterase